MKRTLLALAVLALAAPVFAGDGSIRVADGVPAIPDRYIVVLNDEAASSPDLPSASGFTVPIVAVDMAARYNGTVFFIYESALKGFAIQMTERAAQRLFCHRHTLRYRIRRIEDLTGRDLGNARDRIEFWLALRGKEIAAR